MMQGSVLLGEGYMRIILGSIFSLFIICFVAIVIEETLLGGRRRRKALKSAQERGKEAHHQ
ncbi:MAG: hypothetical protein HIU83_13670 [Proteobacteria bacterium]|nr:hypothetical protein [Pseudomonadota bacterium]